MRRVFVTGGSGFLGGQVSRALLRRGHAVTALVRRRGSIAHPDIREVEGDLERPLDGHRLEGHDVVIHAAALLSSAARWERHQRVNVLGTRQMMAAAARAGVRRFVHVSSLVVLAETPDRVWRETTPLRSRRAGLPPYVRAKIEAEEGVEAASSLGLPVVTVRPGVILGAGDRTTTPLVLNLLRRGLPVRIGSGENRIPCVDVEELADALADSADATGIDGARINLAARESPTQRQLLDTHAAAAALPAPHALPEWAALAAAALCQAGSYLAQSPPWLHRLAVMIACADMRVELGPGAGALGFSGTASCLEAIRNAVRAAPGRAATPTAVAVAGPR